MEHSTQPETGEQPKGVFFDMFLHRPKGAISFLIFISALILSGFQLAPGWEMFHLGWDPSIYYCVVGVCGVINGLLAAERRLVGMIANPIAGLGSLWLLGVVLSFLPAIPKLVLVLVLVIGLLPGIIVYWVLDRLLPKPAEAQKQKEKVSGTD
jgi:hypothetical protein